MLTRYIGGPKNLFSSLLKLRRWRSVLVIEHIENKPRVTCNHSQKYASWSAGSSSLLFPIPQGFHRNSDCVGKMSLCASKRRFEPKRPDIHIARIRNTETSRALEFWRFNFFSRHLRYLGSQSESQRIANLMRLRITSTHLLCGRKIRRWP
jgi:hypothetical protein